MKFPENPEEIPALNRVWEEFATFEQNPHENKLDDADIAELLYVDKLRVLNAVAVMQASIAYRAVRACDLYFHMMNRTKNTENQTYIRPRVRIDRKYSTVEMAWVRRLSKTKPSNPNMPFKMMEREKVGRSFSIQTEEGVLDVLTWYQYIKKGNKDRYSSSIFKNEPVWVRKLGLEVEDKFEILRKEQKTLSSIRRLINTVDTLQMKQFHEQVKHSLELWTNNNSLKAIYVPNLDFTL